MRFESIAGTDMYWYSVICTNLYLHYFNFVVKVMDITVLLNPNITLIIGRPARPEYVFAFLALTVVLSALFSRTTTFSQINELLKLNFKV